MHLSQPLMNPPDNFDSRRFGEERQFAQRIIDGKQGALPLQRDADQESAFSLGGMTGLAACFDIRLAAASRQIAD